VEESAVKKRTRRLAVGVIVAAAALAAATSLASAKSHSAKSVTFVMGMTSGIPANLDEVPFVQLDRAFYGAVGYSMLWVPKANSCAKLTKDGDYMGNLVQSWKASKDGLSIRVTLRKNLVSPNGDPITASDVAWSVRRLFAKSGPVTSAVLANAFAHYETATTVQVVNNQTFILKLAQPSATEYGVWSLGALQIWDATAAKTHATSSDPWATSWVQSNWDVDSPWKLTSFSPGTSATFVPNKGWKAHRGNIGKLVLENISDPSVAFESIQSGALDYVTGLTYSEYASLRHVKGVKVWNCASPSVDQLQLNQAYGPLSKLPVREAISDALDRKTIAQAALNGFGAPAEYGLPNAEVTPAMHAQKIPAPNISKAKQLLSQAGYPNGFPLTITLGPEYEGAQISEEGVVIQSELAKIGITVSLNTVPTAAQYTSVLYAGNFEANIHNDNSNIGDPALAYATYIPPQPLASFHWSDQGFFSLIEKVDEADPNSKGYPRLAGQLANKALDDYAALPLDDPGFEFATRSNVTNVDPVANFTISPVNVVVK
jgi:peptide/nickel transport system substrate-binding protein